MLEKSFLTRSRRHAAAFSDAVHAAACKHLLRSDGQEDICFALWNPSAGATRLSALIFELVLPQDGERNVHGNASFTGGYFARALGLAMQKGCGLALMHSHLGPGWQDLSRDDHVAEASWAPRAQAGTDLPLLGLTFGTDGACSARFWTRAAQRRYEPLWCESVRVVGQRLAITYHPHLRPRVVAGEALRRTVATLGATEQATFARIRFGIVGLGSVGALVNEALVRMGAGDLVHVDYDVVEEKNRDRTHGAGSLDVGFLKLDVARRVSFASATNPNIQVRSVDASILEDEGYRAALDCDVLFCCVDSPWPRRVLNQIAYAHLIPVVDGGILVRIRRATLIGADWNIQIAAPGRRCLECIGAYTPEDVALEQEGCLADPSYVRQLGPDSPLISHENVFPFSMNVASLEVLQLMAMLAGPVPNLGRQNYHYATGRFDHFQDDGCDPGCLYPGDVAKGETENAPIGFDHRAAKARTARGAAINGRQSPSANYALQEGSKPKRTQNWFTQLSAFFTRILS